MPSHLVKPLGNLAVEAEDTNATGTHVSGVDREQSGVGFRHVQESVQTYTSPSGIICEHTGALTQVSAKANKDGFVRATILGDVPKFRPFVICPRSPRSAEQEGWRRTSLGRTRKYGIIYMLTHIASGKRYVGLSKCSFRRRMQGHKSKAKQMASSGGCRKLNAAINKYGWNAFRKEVIYCNIPMKFLPHMERIAINLYQSRHPNGYNLTDGGEISPMLDPAVRERARHVMQSVEVREKRAKAFKSESFLKKVSNASLSTWKNRTPEERAQVALHMANVQRSKFLKKRELKMASMSYKDAKSYWKNLRRKGIEHAKRHLRLYPDRYIGRDPVAEVMEWWGETFDTRRRE